MRENAISIELSDKAKEVYKGLPKEIKKGEYVSTAIVEKHDRDTGTDLETRVTELERKLSEILNRMEK